MIIMIIYLYYEFSTIFSTLYKLTNLLLKTIIIIKYKIHMKNIFKNKSIRYK